MLRQLVDWRQNLLPSVGRTDILALKRRLLIEALFLEAVLHLVQTDWTILDEEQANDLENLTVDWVLNAERNADFRYAELHRVRDRVLLAAAQVLGALSPLRLASITNRFLKEVGARIKADANSATRQEIYNLCYGMRFVRLHADSPAQLAASTNFLDRVHPLKHVAPDKKSRLQQAICDMLTSVLQPLVDEQDPRWGVGGHQRYGEGWVVGWVLACGYRAEAGEAGLGRVAWCRRGQAGSALPWWLWGTSQWPGDTWVRTKPPWLPC